MKKRKIYFIVLLLVLVAFAIPSLVFAAKKTSSMMCDQGVVKVGDSVLEVRDKCGEPDDQLTDSWIYELGSQNFTVEFEEGKVVRIMQSN